MKDLKRIHWIALFSVISTTLIFVVVRLGFKIHVQTTPYISYFTDIVAIIASIGSIFGGNAVMKELLSEIKYKNDTEEKFKLYKSALTKKFLLIGLGGELCAIAYFVGGKSTSLILLGMLLIFLLVSKPATFRIAEDLGITEEQLPE
ncbi:MAG TPA: hypothetical protein VMV56_12285 [Williamwhitmania sp.]|nr:hypothetical protein [Williamwhitmania sp.]